MYYPVFRHVFACVMCLRVTRLHAACNEHALSKYTCGNTFEQYTYVCVEQTHL